MMFKNELTVSKIALLEIGFLQHRMSKPTRFLYVNVKDVSLNDVILNFGRRWYSYDSKNQKTKPAYKTRVCLRVSDRYIFVGVKTRLARVIKTFSYT